MTTDDTPGIDVEELDLAVRSPEGVEVFEAGESIVLSSEAVRQGADGIKLSVDEFQNLAVGIRNELDTE